MNIINGYSTDNQLSQIFKFRLFHLNHPRLKQWRTTRHGRTYHLDRAEQLAVDHAQNNKLVAIDCGGWSLLPFGVDVQCFESDPIARHYYSQCHVEPDLFTHRPTYTQNHTVLTKHPWFLKYSTLDNFVNFIELWTQHKMILNFYERFVQHNHLKYQLVDLVRNATDLDVQVIDQDLWVVTR